MTTPEIRLKRAIAMKKYRDNLKKSNPDEYLKKQRIQKANLRANSKISVPNPAEIVLKIPSNKHKFNDLNNLNNINLLDGTKLNDKSLTKYINSIKRLHLKILNVPFTNSLKFLDNVSTVEKFILDNYEKSSTRTDYFKSIVSILRRIEGYGKLADKYAELMLKYRDINILEVGTNKLSIKESKNYIIWTDIKTLDLNTGSAPHNSFDKTFSKSFPQDYLLYTLYTSLPPRRLEYKFLKIIINKDNKFIAKLSKDYNYIIVENDIPTKIIFNNYKTQKRYGQYIINLNQPDMLPYISHSHVRDIIEYYISKVLPQSGDLIFTDSKNQIYSDFSQKINKIFKPLNKKISVNMLRHSFLTFVHAKNLSMNLLHTIAQYMGHSPLEGMKYRRIKIVK